MTRPNVREQLIEAGLETILEKGFNGCSVQDITEAAGVPKGSFYNHFESKEALGGEIVDRYGQGNPRRALLRDKSVAPLERLRRHFAAISDFYVGFDYGRGCLLGNFSAELSNQSPLVRERLIVLYANWTKDIEAAIRDGQADGSIKTKTDPSDLAAFLLDAYEGALLRARVERNRGAFDRLTDITFNQILV